MVVAGATSLDTSFGALQIGVLVAVFLFGIVSVQANIYASQFPDDRKVFKYLVAVVWLLEVGHTIVITYEIYRATITHYGRPQDYVRYTGLGIATLLGGTLTMLVQCFFAWRLWTVLYHPYRYIGVLCAGLAITRCGVSIFAGIEAIRATSIPLYISKYKPMLGVLLSSGAIIDLIIAVSMLWFLVVRKRMSLEKVARLLDRLVAYTIRTGLVTSVSATAVLIFFFASPTTMIWLACYAPLAKLYTTSLISALNARTSLRGVAGGSAEVSDSNKSYGRGVFQRAPGHTISIQMKTTTEMAVDVPFSQDRAVSCTEVGSPETKRSDKLSAIDVELELDEERKEGRYGRHLHAV